MKKYLPAALLLLLAIVAQAQDIEFLQRSQKTFTKIKSKASFHYLRDEMDSSALTRVGVFKITAPAMSSIKDIYEKAEDTARKSGANAIRLQHLEKDYSSAIFEAYLLTDQEIVKNQSYIEKNTFFVFAGEQFQSPVSYYTFEINGAAKSLKNGTYFRYTLKEGEQVKLRKGTVTGTIMWVKWRPEQLPNYFTIHGFYDEPAVKRTTVSESTKVGKFKPLDSAFGAFLADVLTPAPE